MLRRAFVRRMIFAGLATWFLDLPLPREASAPRERSVQYWLDGREVERIAVPDDGQWHHIEMLRKRGRHGSSVYMHDWAKA